MRIYQQTNALSMHKEHTNAANANANTNANANANAAKENPSTTSARLRNSINRNQFKIWPSFPVEYRNSEA